MKRRLDIAVIIAVAILAASGRPAVAAAGVPDLVVTRVSAPPAGLRPGQAFTVRVTVHDDRSAVAGASVTRFYLSRDTVLDASDILLFGQQRVSRLWTGSSSFTSNVELAFPGRGSSGDYRLLACADDTARVREANEDNNCRAASRSLRIA